MKLWNKIKNLFSKKSKVTKQVQQKNKEQTEHIKQEKFDKGLHKSSDHLNESINNLVKNFHHVDEQTIDAIEEAILSFDVGPASTQKILDAIVEEIKYQNVSNPELIKEIIIDKLFTYYIQNTDINTDINISKNRFNVVLVTGANGVGKTTSIAKMAYRYKQEGYNVSLVAGDTFRAGAVEQLKIWADRIGVPIFIPDKPNQDPASVIYKGLTHAKENNINLVICDTSGRLQNKVNLMKELKKIDNIIKRFDSSQPCESLLVIDATTGQSGISQAKAFNEVAKITGIILTKMDSTSKGGIILSIKDAFNLPVKLIGLGEKLDDLQEFDLQEFIKSLTNNINI